MTIITHMYAQLCYYNIIVAAMITGHKHVASYSQLSSLSTPHCLQKYTVLGIIQMTI